MTTQNNSGLYLQDSFQAARHVSVNYGLRWDYYGVIGERDDRFSLFDAANASVNPPRSCIRRTGTTSRRA